jgi:hypothetical protein
MKFVQFAFFTLGILFPGATASLGDDLPEFSRCVKYCSILACGDTDSYPDITPSKYQNLIKDEEINGLFDKSPVSFYLRFLGWDCKSNCDYQCQRLITKDRMSENLEIYQFHGKWPFIRVLGIQELFSGLFSVGNFIPNYWGFKLVWKHYKSESKKGNIEFANLYWAYILVSIVSMCAWFSSTIFHLKDTWDRERLDYFFAGMTVLTGFNAVCVRYFKLYKCENNFKRNLLGIICVFLYISHVTRLLIDWSYTYNMQANVIIGLLQNILWIRLAIKHFRQVSNNNLSLQENVMNPEYNWTLTPIFLVVSVLFGMSFELFDFPPILELLDAHAIWHFVTIWPQIFWYPYMVKDCEGLKDRKYD